MAFHKNSTLLLISFDYHHSVVSGSDDVWFQKYLLAITINPHEALLRQSYEN